MYDLRMFCEFFFSFLNGHMTIITAIIAHPGPIAKFSWVLCIFLQTD